MEDGLVVKSNALDILEKQLMNRVKKNQYGIVAIGSGTDAYIHQEQQQRMTLGFLQLMEKYRFPVFISTKQTLITRDIELLKRIDQSANGVSFFLFPCPPSTRKFPIAWNREPPLPCSGFN
jgi:DNA repair photolyase